MGHLTGLVEQLSQRLSAAVSRRHRDVATKRRLRERVKKLRRMLGGSRSAYKPSSSSSDDFEDESDSDVDSTTAPSAARSRVVNGAHSPHDHTPASTAVATAQPLAHREGSVGSSVTAAAPGSLATLQSPKPATAGPGFASPGMADLLARAQAVSQVAVEVLSGTDHGRTMSA